MPTIRLIPSTYAVSSTSYLSVSNAENMYHNTDNNTYATITNTYASTSNRYLYLRGFNFSDVPTGDGVQINSVTVKIKGYESGLSTNTSYAPRLANGTSAISNTAASSTFGTSTKTITIPTNVLTWQQIVNYGSNFTIMVYVRRASRNTTGYFYCYGAEIEVDYTILTGRTITTSLTGDGTIVPSGTNTYYDGNEFELTITPTNKSDPVTVTKDGVDVSSELVAHGSESSASLTATDVTTSNIQSGSSYAEYAVGHTAESPSSSGTGNNMYASSGSTGYAQYSFDFSDIPSNVTIEDIEIKAYGHRESNTISSNYVSQCILYKGSSAISDEVDFPSTSDSTITITPNQTVSRSDLDNVTLRHYVGYYGGLVRGITFKVTYSTGTGLDHYTYTFTVSSDSTISVVIGGSASQPVLYEKINDVWIELEIQTAYKKVNGSWVVQSDLTSLFNSTDNFRKGD